MSRITVERAHSLGKEAARVKAEKIGERLANDFGVESAWQGDRLVLKHSGANGHIEVGDDRVTVDLQLSLLLSAMSGMIRERIERSLDKALG